MFDKSMEDLQATATPYEHFKERIRIMKAEESDGGKVDYDEGFVYSFKQ